MLKHTEFVLTEYLRGRNIHLEKTLSYFENKASSIYEETLKDDFIYHWNKLFIKKIENKEAYIENYPQEIKKLPLTWLLDWKDGIEKKYVKSQLNFEDSSEWLIKEERYLISLFSFLELSKETLTHLEENVIDLHYDHKKKNTNTRIVNTIFYLTKMSYLDNKEISKEDIKNVLNALYSPWNNKENKKIFETYTRDEKTINELIQKKKAFFHPEGELLLYCFNKLIVNKDLFIESLNDFAGLNNYRYSEKMKDSFREMLVLEEFVKLDKTLLEKEVSHKKLKV